MRRMHAVDIQFLKASLPYFVIPDMDIIVVHGGILPKVDKFPAITLLDQTDFEALPSKQRKRIWRGMYVRELDAKGDSVNFGDEGPGTTFWADGYDGRFGHAYFGHHPFHGESDPVQFEHATSLDLGVPFGGRLAAAIISANGTVTYQTETANRQYATPVEM